ncbi:P-loop containing nucleoside triphosphate hydrolase protein [Phlegmacium glaucopus]|nr:P-loop containing nucleoside triphosphate hydrolase protein [Phlegmacium glaucopus]
MFNKLLKVTTTLLHEVVLLGLPFPDLHHDVIYDVLSDTTPGYSFLSDERNQFYKHRRFLISAMMDPSKSGTRFSYQAYSNASGVVWNMGGIQEWLKAVETCLGNLFALLHYGSGQPGRGTELSILCWINTDLHPRNFYWFGNLLNVITLYNKTQTNTESQRLISRSLEPQVGQLFILWGTLVVPALVCLAASIRAPSIKEAIRFHTLTFTGLTREWDSDDLSSILSSISGESIADGGLGHPMGLADTRHFLIGVMRKHLHSMVDKYRLTDELFNEQSGHSDGVAIHYALDFASIQNFPEERLHNFRRLSELHHKLITGCLSPDVVDQEALPLAASLRNQSVMQEEQAVKMVALIVPRLAVELAPRIQDNIFDGFAAVTPITAAAGSKSTSKSLSVSTEAGMEVIDVRTVKIDPARYQELYRVVGPKASFLSKEQAAAVELTAQRQHDLFVVLGTGGGKSLVFMAAAANAQEIKQRLITVVVVPLKALLEDLCQRMDEKNIIYSKWTSSSPEVPGPNVRCVLVTVEGAATSPFMTFLRITANQKRLSRVVLDEIHFVLTSQHYRPLMGCLSQLRQLAVQFVYLTATMPISATSELLHKLHALPTAIKLIRAPTIRSNLIYSRFKIDPHDPDKLSFKDGQGITQSIVKFIFDFAQKLKPKERILVYCLSKKDTETLACLLKCDYYHSVIEDEAQREIYKGWISNSRSPILTTTSCLSAGMDYSFVRMVVHWKLPRNLLDKEQESGRAGRDGEEAHSVVFWDPTDRGWSLAPGQSRIGIEEQKLWACTDQCLRIIPGGFMDGKGDTCFQLVTVKLCSWCQGSLSKNTKKMFLEIEAALLQPPALISSISPKITSESLKRKRAESIQIASSSTLSNPLPTYSTIPTETINPVAPITGSRTGMGIAANRATREYNRASKEFLLLKREQQDTKSKLISIRDMIGSYRVCSSCWVLGKIYDHESTKCPGNTVSQSERKSFKRYDVPKGHCYDCCLPQVNGLHDFVSRENPCVNSDFMRHLALTIWQSPKLQMSFLKYIGTTSETNTMTKITEFGSWLMKSQNGWLNITHLVIWAWEHQSTLLVATDQTSQHSSLDSLMVDMSVSQWCDKWGLSHKDGIVLNKLGFEVGDDVHQVSGNDWVLVGALPLQRVRILAAYNRSVGIE